MADEGNKRDQLEETLNSMKKDIAEIKKDMDNLPRWIKNEIDKGNWLQAVVLFYTLGFAFVVATVTLSAEKSPWFMTFIAPTAVAFAVGCLCQRRFRELEKKFTQETKSKQR